AQVISILFKELPPVAVQLRPESGVPAELRLAEAVPVTFGSFGLYRLPPAAGKAFEVDPGQETEVGRAFGPRTSALSLRLSGIESKGDPVARIYCETRDSRKSRFLQISPVGRSMPGTYGLFIAWPRVWRVLAVVFPAALLIGQLRAGTRKRTHEPG
ncbi:MAG: hypothetical protein ACRDIA_03175, partial [Actinomycetota bacterium]